MKFSHKSKPGGLHPSIVRGGAALRLTSLALLVLVAVATGSLSASAQSGGWSVPVTLGPGWFPDIAADPTGQVHAVWSGSVPGFDVVMYSHSQNGDEWSPANDVVAYAETQGDEATRPAIVVDAGGTIQMLSRYTSIYHSSVPATSPQLSSAWALPQRASQGSSAYYSALATDALGNLHMLITENVPGPDCRICYHVFYSRSQDRGQTWSDRVDLSNIDNGAAKPRMAIDGKGNIHVVWEAGKGGGLGQLSDPTQVMYAASYDRGQTWSQAIPLSPPDVTARDVVIDADGLGNPLAVWLDTGRDRIYYQTSADSGRSWSQPQQIPRVVGGWSVYAARLDNYSMASDADGVLHLIFVGRLSDDQKVLSVLHTSWDASASGSQWSPPEIVTTVTDGYPEWPRLAINDSNQLHVVYFVRDLANAFNSDNGHYEVRYVHGKSQAPDVPFRPWPTPTPAIHPATAQPAATATAIAPVSRALPAAAVIRPENSELDALLVIAMNLAPGVLLLGLIVVIVRIRRR